MKVFCNVAMAGILVLSAYMGWTHADEPFLDTERPMMSRRLRIRAALLGVSGTLIVTIVLLDPTVSKAREVFDSMSTTGLKVFWLILMGGIVVSYGFFQLILHDMVANYRTKYWKK